MTFITDPEANMIAFGTSADRLPYWVRATWLYIYDYLGTKGNMNVQWEHDPVDKNKLTSVSVNILSKKDKINPLAYKLTIFISTGTIQVQGNDYNLFVSSHFKVIITLVNKLMGICENNKSESTDADQTIPKGFHDQEKPSTPSIIPVRSATASIQPSTEALTNVKLDLKSDLKHLEANFSEALGKFSEAFDQHLQTELKKVTDKFDSLCTEIKSSSKMVIKDQSKDPTNVVQEIQNLNDTISKQNMETMSLKHKVQSLTLNNKTKQNEMDNKLQVMRSDYELEIAKLQSKLDTQSQLTSDAKQQLNHTTHILNNSVEHLEQKLVAKNSEITNLEGICVNLRLDLETKSNEILSLKIHAANSTSLNEKSYDTKKKPTV